MATGVTRDDMIDWVVEYSRSTEPNQPFERDTVERVIEEVRADGDVVFTPSGRANIAAEAVLIKVAASVIGGLISWGLKAGAKRAWERWIRRPAEEVAKDLDTRPEQPVYPVVVNVIVYVQQTKVELISEKLALLESENDNPTSPTKTDQPNS